MKGGKNTPINHSKVRVPLHVSSTDVFPNVNIIILADACHRRQNVQAPPAAVLDLVEALDADHGKCSVVYVGIVPSATQKLQLQDYSRKFNVSWRRVSGRVVTAEPSNEAEGETQAQRNRVRTILLPLTCRYEVFRSSRRRTPLLRAFRLGLHVSRAGSRYLLNLVYCRTRSAPRASELFAYATIEPVPPF